MRRRPARARAARLRAGRPPRFNAAPSVAARVPTRARRTYRCGPSAAGPAPPAPRPPGRRGRRRPVGPVPAGPARPIARPDDQSTPGLCRRAEALFGLPKRCWNLESSPSHLRVLSGGGRFGAPPPVRTRIGRRGRERATAAAGSESFWRCGRRFRFARVSPRSAGRSAWRAGRALVAGR